MTSIQLFNKIVSFDKDTIDKLLLETNFTEYKETKLYKILLKSLVKHTILSKEEIKCVYKLITKKKVSQKQNDDIDNLTNGIHKLSLNNDKINKDYINNRINNEYCNEIVDRLSDINLLSEYKNCNSVKIQITTLINILKKNDIEELKINNIINDYLFKLIPAGTKGVIRGNQFNSIIRQHIINMKLDESLYDIKFETQCNNRQISEIPDWYIMNCNTKKVIIGMNQLDLWNGGQQINRGSKYLIDCNINNDNTKLVCVVCNKINIKSENNKIYKLFEVGFKKNTLCYIKNLENIIKDFFNQ
jgi:hypothetical protein